MESGSWPCSRLVRKFPPAPIRFCWPCPAWPSPPDNKSRNCFAKSINSGGIVLTACGLLTCPLPIGRSSQRANHHHANRDEPKLFFRRADVPAGRRGQYVTSLPQRPPGDLIIESPE